MLSISTMPQKISNGTTQFRFYLFNKKEASRLYIGTLAASELLTGRFAFLKKIYRKLEDFGFEPDSSQHQRCMVSFFAELDKILVPAAESAEV